ncbi:hypothetical protein JB92DRAFT_2832087 [Gautieria morchelliformis]|nr:hypothetical protein JB92DRAFT_2832087 [Gautieria morchelliformis]
MRVIFTSLVSGFLLATVAAAAPMVNPSPKKLVDPDSTQLDPPTWFYAESRGSIFSQSLRRLKFLGEFCPARGGHVSRASFGFGFLATSYVTSSFSCGDKDALQVRVYKLSFTPRADSVEKWSLATSSQEHGRIATYAVSGGCTSSTGTDASATSGMYEAREIKEKAGEDRMDGGAGVGAAHAPRCLPADGLEKHVRQLQACTPRRPAPSSKIECILSGEMDVVRAMVNPTFRRSRVRYSSSP